MDIHYTYLAAFVPVWMFHHLKITVSQLLETIDRCNLFHFIIGT